MQPRRGGIGSIHAGGLIDDWHYLGVTPFAFNDHQHGALTTQLLMEINTLVQLSGYPGWIVGVSGARQTGFRAWVVAPDLQVKHHDRLYQTSNAAMQAGRAHVEACLADEAAQQERSAPKPETDQSTD